MNRTVKLGLYIALVIIASVSGFFSLKAFGRVMNKARPDTSELEQVEPEKKETAVNPEPQSSTNKVSNSSNAVPSVVETNVAAVSNALNVLASQNTMDTNVAAAGQTNSATVAAQTNTAPSTKASAAVPTAMGAKSANAAAEPKSHMVLWTALFVVSLAVLGLMLASDVSHYFGSKALDVIYNDEGKGVANPEYEEAEQVWANGNHLEAISLMREYLNKNPREQYVALRIAEIYEKDLKNYLAAALEYEEVLKHKLPRERWGWAAIHLCNLYFKLEQEQKAYALLRRVAKEYGDTPAAEKARKRLEQVDGGFTGEQMTEREVDASPRDSSADQSQAPQQESTSNLPPGFRPKK
jgi:TolA-binding protein